MKTRQAFFTVMIILVSFIAILVSPPPGESQECRLVRIYGEGNQPGKIHIEPEVTWIPAGTCIIWVNWSKADQIAIEFEEGKKCKEVTDAPAKFQINASNCYVTSWLPLGATSSLRFSQEGSYQYNVKTPDGAVKIGKIMVQ